MKIFAALILGLALVACTELALEPAHEALVLNDTLEINTLELKDKNGLAVVVNNLEERGVVKSPLQIEGLVRQDWMFEGSFPITLMTLEEDIVKSWYGAGSWLEPLNGSSFDDMHGDDMIEFVSTIDFDAPEGGDMGKIRFAKDLVVDEDEPAFVEMMILWP